MSTVLLLSLSGSPGVTTAAVALTMTWPRSTLLVEADSSRYSAIMPGYLRANVPHTRELGELAVISSGAGSLDINQVWSQTISLSEERAGTIDRRLLPGFRNPFAATAMNPLWGQLAASAASLESGGFDVFFDAGRWSPNDRRSALVDVVDAVLVLARPTLPDIVAAVEPIARLRAQLATSGRENRLALALAEPAAGPRVSDAEIRSVLSIAPLGTIAWDPKTAAVFSEGERSGKRVEQTAYGRSLGSIAAGIRLRLDEARERFGSTNTGTEATK
ncbi:hypothetical protein [Agromyces bauzanensis]